MIADLISWVKLQLFSAWQILIMVLAPTFIACVCWALIGLGWYGMTKNDPGATALRGLIAEVTK